MATTEQLTTRLSEAETALHKVVTGQQTIRLEYDGKSVQYSPSNVSELRAYVRELKVSLGLETGRSNAISIGF